MILVAARGKSAFFSLRNWSELMTRYAYLDGEIGPIEEAAVSVEDRGFLFGDGVYDVARVTNGRAFRLGEHIDRLLDNAVRLEFAELPERATLERAAREVIERTGLDEAMLYMQLTRGSAPRSASPPEGLEPTVLVYVDELRRGVDSLREEGAGAIVVSESRWRRCNIKSINLLPKVLMKKRARAAGCYEALFTSENGVVWEGTSTNLFTVEEGALRTTEHSERLLPGITRSEVIDIAAESGIPVELSTVELDDLYAADEVFLTGTLTEVLGLVEVDGREVGGGSVGPITRRLHDGLLERREAATQ